MRARDVVEELDQWRVAGNDPAQPSWATAWDLLQRAGDEILALVRHCHDQHLRISGLCTTGQSTTHHVR